MWKTNFAHKIFYFIRTWKERHVRLCNYDDLRIHAFQILVQFYTNKWVPLNNFRVGVVAIRIISLCVKWLMSFTSFNHLQIKVFQTSINSICCKCLNLLLSCSRCVMLFHTSVAEQQNREENILHVFLVKLSLKLLQMRSSFIAELYPEFQICIKD